MGTPLRRAGAYSYLSNSPMSFVDPSGLSAPAGCSLGGMACMPQAGGFGLASVVSTYRYRHVDVFVSARIVFGGIRSGGNGPGVLDGWWDFMDPFVEVLYQYITREGIYPDKDCKDLCAIHQPVRLDERH